MAPLSMIRHSGGNVYALPEDIVEHNAAMVMTVYASLMAIAEASVNPRLVSRTHDFSSACTTFHVQPR
jgi:hypothetical protein